MRTKINGDNNNGVNMNRVNSDTTISPLKTLDNLFHKKRPNEIQKYPLDFGATSESETIKVAIRVRPIMGEEKEKDESVSVLDVCIVFGDCISNTMINNVLGIYYYIEERTSTFSNVL
jgi:hypothetical protein